MAEMKAISGARAKLYINGTKLFGLATGVSVQENHMLTRIDVLGEMYSLDIVRNGIAVSGQCDSVRIIKKSLQELGVQPRGDTQAVLQVPKFSMDLYDPITDEFIARVAGCETESVSWRIDKTGVMTQNLGFQGIRQFDEKGT